MIERNFSEIGNISNKNFERKFIIWQLSQFPDKVIMSANEIRTSNIGHELGQFLDASVHQTLAKILKKKIVLILENETYAGVMMLIRSIKGWKNQRKNKLVPMDDLSKWCWKINPPWLSLLISNQPSAKTFLFSFSHNYDSHELIIINRRNHSPKVPNGGSLYHGFGWWVIHFGPGIPSHYR